MKIFFRSDASVHIGTGHIMRCLTLAEELKKRGSDIFFICREGNGNLIAWIREKNFTVYSLPAETDTSTDVALTKKILTEQKEPPEWLVIDHYDIHSAWEASVRSLVLKIMVIDDLADRSHDCDLLLDQNFNLNPGRYDNLVPGSCTRLLGPEYALLRPQFLKTRRNLRERSGSIKRILIAMGGADPGNETGKILRAIKKIKLEDIAIDVAVGINNVHRSEIEDIASMIPNTRCHHNLENISELMASADLAVGAGGISSWERCCLGLPTLLISIAENQRQIAEDLAREGFAVYSGWHKDRYDQKLLDDLRFLLGHKETVKKMSLKVKELVDGKGTERTANFFYHA